MNENFDAFDDFVMKFDMNEDMIKYKYNHSYRVVHQSEEISRSLKLDEENKDIASLIGLLHDIGRFSQWSNYKTYKDKDSIDHGDEAIKILFDEVEIKNYKFNDKYTEVIRKAIKYHNKMDIPNDLSFTEDLHCKILRDADKLDILYAFSTNRLLELKNDDSNISKKIDEDFMNHKLVNKREVVTVNDNVLKVVALCFDINYEYSKNRILEEKYLDKMYESLKNKKIFKKYFDEVKNYLKGEIKNVR